MMPASGAGGPTAADPSRADIHLPGSPTPAATTPSQVGAVVVTYRSTEEAVRCLSSLLAEGVDEAVVVDNDPADPCTAAVARAVPSVAVLVPGVNLGYGAAANRGAAVLGKNVDWVLICNPDLVFSKGSLAALVASASIPGEGVGIAGPRLVNPDGTFYPSARRVPDPLTAGLHAVVGLFAKDNRFSRRYRMEDGSLNGRARVDWVSGACLLVRREVFEALGGFDESFFMYVEDVDLCRRAREAGYAVIFEPGARVEHVQGTSTATRPLAMVIAHHRSAMRYAIKTLRGWRRPLVPVATGVLAARAALAVGSQVLRSSRRAPGR